MVKTILKELIILILLVAAILLILGVIFYEYIPSNKVVPNKIAYSTPNNIAEEIKQEVTEAQPVNITYRLDEKDIKVSQSSGDYKPGKQNPFASYSTNEVGNETGNSGTGNSQTGNSNSGSSNSNSNTGYLPDGGTK